MDAVPIVPPLFRGTKNTTLHELQTGDTSRAPDMVDGKSFRLADEVRYIQRRAADHTGRVISIGQLILFSSESGDAWLVDPSDQLVSRLARDGDPEPVHIDV